MECSHENTSSISPDSMEGTLLSGDKGLISQWRAALRLPPLSERHLLVGESHCAEAHGLFAAGAEATVLMLSAPKIELASKLLPAILTFALAVGDVTRNRD